MYGLLFRRYNSDRSERLQTSTGRACLKSLTSVLHGGVTRKKHRAVEYSCWQWQWFEILYSNQNVVPRYFDGQPAGTGLNVTRNYSEFALSGSRRL